MKLQADIAVLGGGFGGSLTAACLQRAGFQVVLVDRGRHPRFAIGESSTPIADFVLRDLAEQYQLTEVAALTSYGRWRQQRPELACGLKRGFSYFRHWPGQALEVSPEHHNELMVAASSDDLQADTHWYRADVDAFLAEQAAGAGVRVLDQTQLWPTQRNGRWQLDGSRIEEPVHVRADFLVDASGAAGVLPRALGLADHADQLRTRSAAVYGHFHDLPRFAELLDSGAAADYPFDCDRAAQHHLLDEGWMWQLRFDNSITSAGLALELRDDDQSLAGREREVWQQVVGSYPSLARQFRRSRLANPPGALLSSGRMQRLAGRAAGDGWALLPNTAGFIDPLHSSGIAQTLCGVERLVGLLRTHWQAPALPAALQEYEATLRSEFSLIDMLVSGCYRARQNFRLFSAFAMLYFVAAVTYEQRRRVGGAAAVGAFLCADDLALYAIVQRQHERLVDIASSPVEDRVAEFEAHLAEAVKPYNSAGLCDPTRRNMYRHTAAR